MSITDELRECIRTANRSYEDARNPYNDREILHIPEEELTAIADRIDEAVENEVQMGYARGYRECQDDMRERAEVGSGITGELRDFAQDHLKVGQVAQGGWREALLAVADSIDEAHMREVTAAWNRGYDRAEEELPNDADWVELPNDADGVPIHIGDMLYSDHYEDGTVACVQMKRTTSGADRWIVAVQPFGWDTATWYDPEEYTHRHAKPDTWERIIEDAAKLARGDNAFVLALVERCRRLAGDGR